MPTPRATPATARVRPRTIVVGLVIVAVLAGMLGLASILLTPPAPVAPRGAVPPATAPMSTVAGTYMAAAKSHDCGLTRVLTSSNTTSWCDTPRLLSYRLLGRTGPDGECMAYEITIDAGSDVPPEGGSKGWSMCFRQTKAGWRLWDQGQG